MKQKTNNKKIRFGTALGIFGIFAFGLSGISVAGETVKFKESEPLLLALYAPEIGKECLLILRKTALQLDVLDSPFLFSREKGEDGGVEGV